METQNEEIQFGDKVRFTAQDKVHPDLRNKDFCLLGMHTSAFALVEWDKRGSYNFEYYTGKVQTDLVKV